MFKKLLSFVLACLLLQMAYVRPVTASTVAEKEVRFAEKVKVGIAKLGVGPEARIEVKLRDKTKLKGYVGKAGEESFVVVNTKTGAATTVAYPQVVQVKGKRWSASTISGIVVTAFLATVILVVAISMGNER